MNCGRGHPDAFEIRQVASDRTFALELISRCVDRMAGDGGTQWSTKWRRSPSKGLVASRSEIPMETRPFLRSGVARFSCHRSESRRSDPAGDLFQRARDAEKKKIDWKLSTGRPFGSRANAIGKVEWYAFETEIEVFHKIVKSG
jgi:hypothetical protein